MQTSLKAHNRKEDFQTYGWVFDKEQKKRKCGKHMRLLCVFERLDYFLTI